MFKKSYIDYIIENDMGSDQNEGFDEAFVNVTHTEKVILIYLLKQTQGTMGQIGEKINMSKSATNFVVGKLVKLDFVQKNRSETDNRVVYVTLTDSGLNYVKELVDVLSARFTSYVSKYLSAVKSEVDSSDQIAIDRVIEILTK